MNNKGLPQASKQVGGTNVSNRATKNISKQGKTPKLYIIEQNSLAASSLREALGILGRDVHLLSNSDPSLISVSGENEPAIVIIDATTLGVAAEKFVPLVRLRLPTARILIIAEGLPDDDICRLLGCGAHGFVPYSQLRRLPLAIRAVMRNHLCVKPHILETYVRRASESNRCRSSESFFTPRETAILRLLKCRLSNKQIGSELSLSERTVKFHLANVYRKLGIHSRDSVISALQCSGIQVLQ